ncbi:serine/threonine protein kinase psk1, partial [Blyttiomyces sp. JEL0837]
MGGKKKNKSNNSNNSGNTSNNYSPKGDVGVVNNSNGPAMMSKSSVSSIEGHTDSGIKNRSINNNNSSNVTSKFDDNDRIETMSDSSDEWNLVGSVAGGGITEDDLDFNDHDEDDGFIKTQRRKQQQQQPLNSRNLQTKSSFSAMNNNLHSPIITTNTNTSSSTTSPSLKAILTNRLPYNTGSATAENTYPPSTYSRSSSSSSPSPTTQQPPLSASTTTSSSIFSPNPNNLMSSPNPFSFNVSDAANTTTNPNNNTSDKKDIMSMSLLSLDNFDDAASQCSNTTVGSSRIYTPNLTGSRTNKKTMILPGGFKATVGGTDEDPTVNLRIREYFAAEDDDEEEQQEEEQVQEQARGEGKVVDGGEADDEDGDGKGKRGKKSPSVGGNKENDAELLLARLPPGWVKAAAGKKQKQQVGTTAGAVVAKSDEVKESGARGGPLLNVVEGEDKGTGVVSVSKSVVSSDGKDVVAMAGGGVDLINPVKENMVGNEDDDTVTEKPTDTTTTTTSGATTTTTTDTSHQIRQKPPKRKVGLDDFDLLKVIGKGAYGKVFLVRKKKQPSSSTSTTTASSTQPPKLYAMKVLRKATLTLHTKTVEHTKNERSILEQIQHPFIVKLWYAFQTPAKLYLILEYAPGGELFSHLANERMFSEDVAGFYIGDLLLALEHLHSLGIIYRDLKPENVLLDSKGHVLLTDFGLSKVALSTLTICGTIEFTAPEVLESTVQYGYGVDHWSLGVMLYDMLTGSPPFTGNNRKKVMESIMKKKPTFPVYLTSYAKDLLTKLLKRNPAQRIGSGPTRAKEIMNHGFFRRINWKLLEAKLVEPPI